MVGRLWYPFTIGPVAAIREMLTGRRGEDYLELTDFAITTSVRGSARRLALDELGAIETDLRAPHIARSPLIQIRTLSVEAIAISESLYPDPVTVYPSIRHRDRAHAIAEALDRAVPQQRTEPDG